MADVRLLNEILRALQAVNSLTRNRPQHGCYILSWLPLVPPQHLLGGISPDLLEESLSSLQSVLLHEGLSIVALA